MPPPTCKWMQVRILVPRTWVSGSSNMPFPHLGTSYHSQILTVAFPTSVLHPSTSLSRSLETEAPRSAFSTMLGLPPPPFRLLHPACTYTMLHIIMHPAQTQHMQSKMMSTIHELYKLGETCAAKTKPLLRFFRRLWFPTRSPGHVCECLLDLI